MISPLRHTRPLFAVLLLSLILAPVSASAQLEFGGISWGTPVEGATERIRQAGHPFRGVDQEGNPVFRAPDGGDLVATFDSVGLVGVELAWFRDPGRLPARFARLADSLRRVYGSPDSQADAEEEPRLVWEREGAMLELFLFPRGGGMDSVLMLQHHGAGWEAEFDRRSDAEREQDAYEEENGRADTTAYGDWLRVYSDARDFTRVDTVRFTRLGDRLYRARFMDSWFQRRRLENGMMYNGALTEVELDCRRMTTRLLRTIPLYSHRATVTIEAPPGEPQQWLPPMPNANHARAVAAACAALGRQP